MFVVQFALVQVLYTNWICFAPVQSECQDAEGGSESGNCAAGFGVCCVVYLSVCSSDVTITKNCTYVTNPGYPVSETNLSYAIAAKPIQKRFFPSFPVNLQHHAEPHHLHLLLRKDQRQRVQHQAGLWQIRNRVSRSWKRNDMLDLASFKYAFLCLQQCQLCQPGPVHPGRVWLLQREFFSNFLPVFYGVCTCSYAGPRWQHTQVVWNPWWWPHLLGCRVWGSSQQAAKEGVLQTHKQMEKPVYKQFNYTSLSICLVWGNPARDNICQDLEDQGVPDWVWQPQRPGQGLPQVAHRGLWQRKVLQLWADKPRSGKKFFFDHMVQFHIIAVSAQYFHLTGRFRFCLRQERGYCTTRWSVNTADANPFSVSMVVFTCGKRATGYGVNPVVVVGVVVVGGSPCMI